uniref:NADH-ubiquinone oxidoreductase chain 4 n=1 Tax=Asellus aquaticus TaxID=92525 RepID=E3SX67_ASEAQ|nr:NADH dehydrogenase subunit 4 [Asellus aquaticus]
MMKVLFILLVSLQLGLWSILMFALSILLIMFLLLGKHDMDWFMVSWLASWDSVGYSLTLLSIWIIMLMVLASYGVYRQGRFSYLYNWTMVALLVTLVMAFSSSNLLMFYIFFEASLIPTFMLILGWGYQPERLRAGVYMMLYTVFASLPLLLVLLSLGGKDLMCYSMESNLTPSGGGLVMIGAMLAFMVKLPLYLVHLWLPKAHVEAPVAGSMILASVLLSLGGYGVVRILPKVSSYLASTNWVLMFWSMMGGVYVSMACLRQTDVKVLIALSSVAHMAMVFGGILTMTTWGVNGAVLVMMGHGFCSSGLFCIANMSYERSGTRSLLVMKGAQSILPALTLWWFLLAAANMAAPPSMNLLGEIHSILGTVRWSLYNMVPVAGLVFLAAAYSIYLYVMTQHGKPSNVSFSALPISSREHLTMLLHWVPINLMVVKYSMLQMFV